ncbi:RHS repeat-associated core domain-containing protein [Streptomyces sp. NPDC002588]|uniref:RHS repeat-associated core domain-containing protein n=1 Tax=Streptomyces sp. NPDC002588 TaxID=3154419 RepID=UPI00331A0FA1
MGDATGARSIQVDHDPSGDTSHDTTATYTPFAAGAGPAHAVAQVSKVTTGDAAANTTNSYTYDAAGNARTRTTRAGTDTLTYNDEGDLAELSSTGTSGDTTYLYDADGTLLLRRSPDATTLYTGDEEITLDKGAGSADGVRYISLAGETVATHSSDGKFTYLIPDRQGTGTLAVDSQTQQVTRRQYKPFGESRDQSGTWTAGQRGFVGGTEDDNTGLTNLGAREYDPTIGRFLSPDPLLDPGAPQSWNAYDYADDTPVTTSDPSGDCADIDCPTRNCAYCLNYTPGNSVSTHASIQDHPGSGSTPNNTKSYAKRYQAEVSNSTAHAQAEERALQRQKATADAAAAAAKKQASGFKHQMLSLIADVIGLTDAYNCFTKGDVMGCVNTALTAVPWGKVFKAIKVGVEAFKIWRALDRAYTAVKDAEEAAKVADDALAAERAIVEAEKAEGAGAEAASCVVHSFVPSTEVRLADGSSKPISNIKAGDTVLATDPQTGVTAPEKVQNVIVTTTDKDFTTLTLDTTPVRGPPSSQTLTTTWHHPFWDPTHHRWTDAHDLTPGTKLRQPDGTTVTVTGVRNFHQAGVTYDLTVGTLHTYYVLAGAIPVLVHNCDEQIYEAGGKHGSEARSSSRGENSAEPQDGQGALDNSVQIKPTSPRRVGVDPSNGDTVILDRTGVVPCGCTTPGGTNEIFHGHVRTNMGTDPGMAKAQSVLRKGIKAGLIKVP